MPFHVGGSCYEGDVVEVVDCEVEEEFGLLWGRWKGGVSEVLTWGWGSRL